MINFEEKKGLTIAFKDRQILLGSLRDKTGLIRRDLTNTKHNRVMLGAHLIDLYESNSYCVNQIPVITGNADPVHFFRYCEAAFDLDRSAVSRAMNICSEFADDTRARLREEWESFSYSVLSELLSLTAEEREPVKSNWTVAQVRAYKKSFGVATSQQSETETKKKPAEDFPQFKGWKRTDFCRRIVTLEDENRKLKEQLADQEPVDPDDPLEEMLNTWNNVRTA